VFYCKTPRQFLQKILCLGTNKRNKMKLNLSTIGAGYGATAALNANFDAIEQAIENTLSLDGTTPNEMGADLDMNGQNILNAETINTASLVINGTPVEPSTGVTAASAFQTYTFTATAAQTTFSVAPYTPYVPSVVVEVNGLSLAPSDISVSGTNVVIPACSAGDEVVIRRFTDAPYALPGADDIPYTAFGTGSASETVQSALDRNTRFTKPLLIVITGQSNAVGINSGGNNPSNSLVKTWNPATSSWVSGGQYTAAPWTSAVPDGNGGNNNFALSAAHYLAERTGRSVYIVFDAVSGQSITEWVPATQARYVGIKTKVANALASAELIAAGKTTIDFMIWAQGEENGAGVNAEDFATYLANLTALDTQLRAESWIDEFTPIYIMGMSPLHDRYQISPALQHFSNKSNGRWRYLSTRSLRTQYQTTGSGDYTHWLGDSLWQGGYNIIGPAFLNNQIVNQEDVGSLFFSRGEGVANLADTIAISSFGSLLSWGSRTSGSTLTETFSGNGSTTAFLLDYRGTTISSVLVNGVSKTSPTDYTLSTGTDQRITITFTVAPSAGTNNIVIDYGAAINAAASTGSLGWGYACYPDGNYTIAGGFITGTSNLCNYSIVYGRELWATDAADYSAAFGYQNELQNTYQFAAGRGITLADSGTAAVGTFPAYTTTQTDPVSFQVGVGTSSAAKSNAFAVRKSGVTEHKTLTVATLPTAGIAGRRAFVTDATVTTFASVVVGGGANKVPVYDDGTSWRIG
jgi:hypothetical protein